MATWDYFKFGGKSHSHLHLVKQRQLKRVNNFRKRKAEIVSVSVLSINIIVMSTNLEYRESRQQASKAQQEKEWEIDDKRDIFLLEERDENFVAVVGK